MAKSTILLCWRFGRGLRVAATEFVAPRDHTEKVLVDIWADLLGVEHIGVFDNFFDLGGHSLLAGQVLAEFANAFQVSLPIRTLFEAPTVDALARRVDQERAMPTDDPTLKIARMADQGSQAVSFVQEQMLRMERELPGLPQFNLSIAYRLQGPLNVAILERSVDDVIRQHDSLRTGFAWVNERPVASIASAADTSSSIIVEDLAARMPAANNRVKALLLKKAELRAEQEAWTPFDLRRSSLFRIAPLADRRRRPRPDSDLAPYHRRWLVDRSVLRGRF